MQRLGEGYLDSYNIVINPTSVIPPPPPPPPPPVNWILLAVLGLVGLAVVSGGK